MKQVWERLVIVFYRQRGVRMERSAIAVVRARSLTISQDTEEGPLRGSISDFFPLMGEIDHISSKEGQPNRYVLCCFDDGGREYNDPWRLIGVTFPQEITFHADAEGKRTYEATFRAKGIELE